MKLVARLIYRLNRLRWRVCRPVTLGVRVLLVKEGAVVLVKHTYHDHWYLPGGASRSTSAGPSCPSWASGDASAR